MSIPELYEIFLAHPDVTTDTRQCLQNGLFFALRGSNFNGNDFASQALKNGCAFAVVDEPSLQGKTGMIFVENVLATMQQLATFHRRQLGTPIVQITGTNGKTTTKELTAAVLASEKNVLFTQGNLNNHIGVPKTLLRLRPHHEVAVIETGANHQGEIAQLAEIADPDCGLITNVGHAHLEGFGSFEGVVQTKTELYAFLRRKPESFVFLHGDDTHLVPKAQGLPTVTYGQPGKGFDVEGETLSCTPFLHFRFRLKVSPWHEVQTHLIGTYNLPNALAAIAVGGKFGITPTKMAEAIAQYVPTNNRSEWVQTPDNRVIVDAYNANPTSMKAALENFSAIPAEHKMMILGEMLELGKVSTQEHWKIYKQALNLHCDALWLVGEAFRSFVTADRVSSQTGMNEETAESENSPAVCWFPDVDAVKAALSSTQAPRDFLILVKGSNGTRLFQLPPLL